MDSTGNFFLLAPTAVSSPVNVLPKVVSKEAKGGVTSVPPTLAVSGTAASSSFASHTLCEKKELRKMKNRDSISKSRENKWAIEIAAKALLISMNRLTNDFSIDIPQKNHVPDQSKSGRKKAGQHPMSANERREKNKQAAIDSRDRINEYRGKLCSALILAGDRIKSAFPSSNGRKSFLKDWLLHTDFSTQQETGAIQIVYSLTDLKIRAQRTLELLNAHIEGTPLTPKALFGPMSSITATNPETTAALMPKIPDATEPVVAVTQRQQASIAPMPETSGCLAPQVPTDPVLKVLTAMSDLWAELYRLGYSTVIIPIATAQQEDYRERLYENLHKACDDTRKALCGFDNLSVFFSVIEQRCPDLLTNNDVKIVYDQVKLYLQDPKAGLSFPSIFGCSAPVAQKTSANLAEPSVSLESDLESIIQSYLKLNPMPSCPGDACNDQTEMISTTQHEAEETPEAKPVESIDIDAAYEPMEVESLSKEVVVPPTPPTIKEIVECDTRLVPHIANSVGYYIDDSFPYNEYTLDPDLRRQYISPDTQTASSVRRRWFVSVFEPCQSGSITEDMVDAMAFAVSDAKTPSSKNAPEKSVGVSWLPINSTAPSAVRCLDVAEFSREEASEVALGKNIFKLTPAPETGVFAIYNNHETHLTIKFGENSCMVTKGEGAIFSYCEEHPFWNQEAFYKNKKKYIETNPLRPESLSSIVHSKNVHSKDKLPRPLDGELFLTEKAIKFHLQSQNKIEGSGSTIICKTDHDIVSAVRKLNIKSTKLNLIFINTHSNHYVAVRVMLLDDKVIIYIHEPLQYDNDISVMIRNSIIGSVYKFFENKSIHAFTPTSTFQKDYTSCGVFSLKAIKAFNKNSNIDNWLKKMAENNCGKVSWNSKKNEAILPDSSKLLIRDMPPLLLKQAHIPLREYSEEQKREPVSHKDKPESLSLEEYIRKYQPKIDSTQTEASGIEPAKIEPAKPNLSTICKRYKYLLLWQQQREADGLSHSVNKASTSLKPSFSRWPVADILAAAMIRANLFYVRNAGTLEKANQALANIGEKAILVQDWINMENLEHFSFNTRNLTETELNDLKIWLEALYIKPEKDNMHQSLMRMWYEVVLSNDASSYKIDDYFNIMQAIQAKQALKRKQAIQAKQTRERVIHTQQELKINEFGLRPRKRGLQISDTGGTEKRKKSKRT